MKKISEAKSDLHKSFNIGECFTFSHSTIEFEDDAPGVEIGYGVTLTHCHITIHQGGTLLIKDMSEIRGRIIIERNSTVEIGYGLICNGPIYLHSAEKRKITIKDDCLFANVQIYNSDLHALFSLENRERINPAQDVVIGNRVWLARDVLILKGTELGDGCAVGARSVFTGHSQNNCLLVGSPAKTVKHNICWSRQLIDKLSELLPLNFPVAKFKSHALQFNHNEVIKTGICVWQKREKMNVNDYYVMYYLSRSLLLGPFRESRGKSISVSGNTIMIAEVLDILLSCFKLSEKRNLPCGCYAFLAAKIAEDVHAADDLYQFIKPLSPHIDNVWLNFNQPN